MTTYLISYELSKPYHRNHLLSQALMCLGDSWARPLQNTWYIRSKETEGKLKQKLGPFIDGEDAFLIQIVDEEVTLVNTSLRWFKQKSSNSSVIKERKIPEFQPMIAV